MNHDTIELFCGAGGGVVAHTYLLNHTPVAAAEWGEYQRKVLRARQRDGVLPPFTITSDVRQFNGKPYRGIGVVSGGFPCQDLSAAGSGVGIDGERSGLVWEMLRVVGEAEPRFVFAENSPRLRAKGLNRIVMALSVLGYGRCAWGIVSGRDVGAPHIRERMWLLARRGGSAVAGLPVNMPRDGRLWDGRLEVMRRIVPQRRAPTMPTLTAKDSVGMGNRPTPTLWSLSDILGITAKAKRMGITLPTLAATDWKNPYGTQGLLKQLEKRSKPLRDVLPLLEGGRKINPAWAEWYMGWPPGWTDLDPCSPKGVAWWRSLVADGAWWTDEVERAALPRTLPSLDVPNLNARIHALGNGQIPLACSAAFIGLEERLQ